MGGGNLNCPNPLITLLFSKASSIDCARVSRSLKRLLQQLQQGHQALKDLQWTWSQRLGGGRKSLHHSKRLNLSTLEQEVALSLP